MIPTKAELDALRYLIELSATTMETVARAAGTHDGERDNLLTKAKSIRNVVEHLLACHDALRELVAGLDDSRDRSVIGGTCALMHAESAARALIGD